MRQPMAHSTPWKTISRLYREIYPWVMAGVLPSHVLLDANTRHICRSQSDLAHETRLMKYLNLNTRQHHPSINVQEIPYMWKSSCLHLNDYSPHIPTKFKLPQFYISLRQQYWKWWSQFHTCFSHPFEMLISPPWLQYPPPTHSILFETTHLRKKFLERLSAKLIETAILRNGRFYRRKHQDRIYCLSRLSVRKQE